MNERKSPLSRLIGLSAGKICYMDLPDRPEFEQLVDSAEIVWENLMSAWTFKEIWMDGTTLWLSPEREKIATVSPDGEYTIQDNSDL